MEQIDPNTRPPLSLEQVAVEALALHSLPDLPARAQRFLTTVQAWAAPSLVVCLRRDARAEAGWATVVELTSGQTPPGFERFLTQLDEEAESITRPFLVRPGDQAPGVKVRDTWVIPWSHPNADGLMVLRGIPRPYPPNLGDAIALLAQPLWPLAAGNLETSERAVRLEWLIAEARRLAEGLAVPVPAAVTESRAAEIEESQRALATAQAEVEEGRAERDRVRQALDEAMAEGLKAQAERDELRAEKERLGQTIAAAETEREQARTDSERVLAERDQVRTERDRVQADLERALAERDQAQSDRDQLRAETEKLRTAADKPEAETAIRERDDARTERDRLSQAVAAAENDRDQATQALEEAKSQAQRDRDEHEKAVAELRSREERIRDLEAKVAVSTSSSEAAEALASAQRERDETRKSLTEAQGEAQRAREERDQAMEKAAALQTETEKDRERIEAFEKARGVAEAEREFARGEASDLRAQTEALNQRVFEADEARKQAQQRAEALEAEKGAAVAERDRLQVQVNQLWSSIESFQRDLKGERDRIQTERTAMEAARRTLEKAAEDATQRAAQTEKERDEWRTLQMGSVQTYRDVLKTAHRTPFAPPMLRMALEEVEKLLEPEAANRKNWPRALFLDRDPFGLEKLVGELEASGIEALVATYPEEVGFFLKTPDARGLNAVICDVMAFRPDHNLGEIFKLWRQDAAGIAMLLSFRADNATESERAQRIPSTLTAGYLPRPIQRDVLTDAIHGAHRRHGGPKR